MTAVTLPHFSLILPELSLAAGALVLVLVGAVWGQRASAVVNIAAFALTALAAVAVAMQSSGRTLAFGNSYALDDFSRFMKMLALIGSASALVLANVEFQRARLALFEFPLLVLLSTLGMMVMI